MTGTKAYALAVVTMTAAIAITRLTWPAFGRAPFALMFLAVYLTVRFGTKRAGWLAVALGAFGSMFANPDPAGARFVLSVVAIAVVVGLLAAHLVAERDLASRAHQASEVQLRATWDYAALGAALLDRQGIVARVNPALERLLGYSSAEWAGAPFDRFTDPDDLPAERARFERLMSGEGLHDQCEQRYRRSDGTLVWCHVTVSAIRPSAGAPAGALMAVEDITARRQAEADLRASEEKLRQAQKMEAVGQLVAGVAHNFNNLLTITMGYTEVLLERHRGSEEDRADLDQIRQATGRAASLTRQLLAFSRQKATAPAAIDLNHALADLRPILTRAIREDIQLTIQTAPAPATVLIDLQDFDQVILNLVINARDALPSGGAIEITLEPRSLGAADCPADLSPGEYVCAEIRDNGVGMTPEVQAHLFEPFFTTKEVGKGTGLGLASTYGTVRHHRGSVKVTSAPGQGTIVTLFFPHTTAVVTTDLSLASALGWPWRKVAGATILIVEDEKGVRAVTAGTLSRAGHRVLEAASPVEACTIFDRHADDIDLLVTDVVMPGMRGPVLAQRLLAKRPGLPVLLVSGYADVDGEAIDTGQMRFLAKPFTPSRLVAVVAELLSSNKQLTKNN